MDDSFLRPHLAWRLAVGLGMALLTLLASSAAAHAWWDAHVFALPARAWLAVTWVVAVGLHALEARLAYRIALRTGRARAARRWALQTLLYGYPSLRLLLRPR